MASACAELEEGRPVVRAVIVKTWGSTPREVGADMLVDTRGGLLGTVGGGCGEAEVFELAQDLLSPETNACGYLTHVDLTENPDEGGDKVCGGRFDVLVYRLDPKVHGATLVQVRRILEQGGRLCLSTGTGKVSPGFWRQGILSVPLTSWQLSLGEGTASQSAEWEQSEQGGNVFLEPLGQQRRLIIVGAGHIARPLARLASITGYRVVVIDDRPEYARAEFFPDAEAVIAGEYVDELPRLADLPCTSVVLVTRGHKHDQDCLRLMAGRPLDYLGMIGSQRRIEAVYADLIAEGASVESLRAVHAPIGLEIGARTPAEIAVSILAQMIKKQRLSEASLERSGADRQRHQRSLG